MPEKMTRHADGAGYPPSRCPVVPIPVGGRAAATLHRRHEGPSARSLFHLSAIVLGPLWFALLVTGWATGLGLLITLLGLPVDLADARRWPASWPPFEAGLARELLGADVDGAAAACPAGDLRSRA